MTPAAIEASGELARELTHDTVRAPAGKLLVMEHKTSSEDIGLGSKYWIKLTLDGQISGYLVGARSLGYEPDGALYDVLRKPALRPYEPSAKRARAESPEEYRERVLDEIAARPDYYYQRGVVVRLEEEERDAAFDAWQTADAIRLSRHEDRWPRNPDACDQYHRLCDYWEVCSGNTRIDDPTRFAAGGAHPELEGTHHLPMITASSSRAYRACPRRYQYAYEMGMRPRAAAATSLVVGRRIHVALEAWLRGGYDLDAALAALQIATLDHDAARVEAMIRGYHARWSGEPLEILAVEQEFSCALVNPATGAPSRTFVRAGKIDAIVRTQG